MAVYLLAHIQLQVSVCCFEWKTIFTGIGTSEAISNDAMEPNSNKEAKKQPSERTFCTLNASEELSTI